MVVLKTAALLFPRGLPQRGAVSPSKKVHVTGTGRIELLVRRYRPQCNGLEMGL